MKKLFLLLAVFSTLFFSGCVYMLFPSSSKLLCYDDEKPFCDLIGKEAKLLRPLNVYDSALVDLDKKDQDSVKVYFGDSNKIPHKLPKGTIIKFDSFHVSKDYAIGIPCKIRYTVYFQVPSLGLPKQIRFFYVWGRGKYLHRAPWENDTVPESRYVGFNGKSYYPE